MELIQFKTCISMGVRCLVLKNEYIPIDPKFEFYLINYARAPCYSPLVLFKLQVIDYTITREGLVQQMLSVICRAEAPKDEEERVRLSQQNLQFKTK